MSSNSFSVKVEVTPSGESKGCGGHKGEGKKAVASSLPMRMMQIFSEDACLDTSTDPDSQKNTFSGLAVKLAGFGYPVEGWYLIYSAGLDEVPVSPATSSDIGFAKTAISIDSSNGEWIITRNETCSALPISNPAGYKYRKIVTYFKYHNAGGDYYLIDSLSYTVYPCAALASC